MEGGGLVVGDRGMREEAWWPAALEAEETSTGVSPLLGEEEVADPVGEEAVAWIRSE